MYSRIFIRTKSLTAAEALILGLILITVGASDDQELDRLERELLDGETDSLNPVEYYETLKQWEALAGTRQLDRPLAIKIRTMLEMSEIDKSRCSKELVQKFDLIYRDQSWFSAPTAKDYTWFVALMQFNTCVQELDRICRRNMNTMTIEHKNMLSHLLEGACWLGEIKMHHRSIIENGLYGNECELHTESRRLVASAAYYMWQKVEGISRADHHSDEQHWEHFSRAYRQLFGGSFCDPIRETYRELGSDWEYSSLLLLTRWKLQLEIHREWDRMETLCHFLVLGEGDFATRKTYEYFKMHLDGRKRYYPAAEVVGVAPDLYKVISRNPLEEISMSWEVARVYNLLDEAGMGDAAFRFSYLEVNESRQHLRKLAEVIPDDESRQWRMDGILLNHLDQIASFQEFQCESVEELERRSRLAQSFSIRFNNLDPYTSDFYGNFLAPCEMVTRLEAERIFRSVPHDQVMRLELIRRTYVRELLSVAGRRRTHLTLSKMLLDKAMLEKAKEDLMDDISDGLEPLTTFTSKLEGIQQKMCQGLTGPDVDRLLERVDVPFRARPNLTIGEGTRMILTYMRICKKGPIEDWKISAAYAQYKLEVLGRRPRSRHLLFSRLNPEVKES